MILIMKQKLVSIILPVYNSEEYIEDTINSVLSQTYPNFELIIINDGSNDNSGIICEKISKIDNRIQYFSIPNSGVSNARNLALAKVNGEYVTFIDSDDLYAKNYLEVLINTIEKYDADIISCAYQTLSITPKKVDISEDYLNCSFQEYIEKLQPNLLFNQLWNKMYKLSIIKENRIIFDTSIDLAEDYKFNLEYMNCTTKNIYVNIPLYQYRITDNGLGFKYRKNSSEIKLSLLKKLEKIYEEKGYSKNYIYKNYIIQYLAYFSNIIDIRNKDSNKIKKIKIKNLMSTKDYQNILKEIKNNSNFRYKLISKVLSIKNVHLMYFLGILANYYDKYMKRKKYSKC